MKRMDQLREELKSISRQMRDCSNKQALVKLEKQWHSTLAQMRQQLLYKD